MQNTVLIATSRKKRQKKQKQTEMKGKEKLVALAAARARRRIHIKLHPSYIFVDQADVMLRDRRPTRTVFFFSF